MSGSDAEGTRKRRRQRCVGSGMKAPALFLPPIPSSWRFHFPPKSLAPDSAHHAFQSAACAACVCSAREVRRRRRRIPCQTAAPSFCRRRRRANAAYARTKRATHDSGECSAAHALKLLGPGCVFLLQASPGFRTCAHPPYPSHAQPTQKHRAAAAAADARTSQHRPWARASTGTRRSPSRRSWPR